MNIVLGQTHSFFFYLFSKLSFVNILSSFVTFSLTFFWKKEKKHSLYLQIYQLHHTSNVLPCVPSTLPCISTFTRVMLKKISILWSLKCQSCSKLISPNPKCHFNQRNPLSLPSMFLCMLGVWRLEPIPCFL